MLPAPRAEVISLGCRLNIAESETIRNLLGARDVVVVNSCAVTAEAVKATRQAIRRARRDRPGAELVVTGCAADIARGALAAMPEIDRIVANDDKLAPARWGASGQAPVAASTETARAFVAVQTGCDHACTFCVIPQGRGRSRSLDADAVTTRIGSLVAAGKREVVLTGVDLTSWGHDLPGAPTLGSLCERILRDVPALSRLRLSSIDSIEIDAALFDLLASEPRMMPHVHLSLQAGDDLTLKRMKRRHLRADAVAIVERLKARRDMAIGADLIAGFPTETAAMFANTLALLDDCDIVHAHVFPYSPRPQTPAARMPQVEPAVRRERAGRLRTAAAVRKATWLRGLVGTRQAMLVEKPGDRGHTETFAEVRLASGRAEPVAVRIGDISEVRIVAAADTHLIGTFA